jgi:hypothetical protein
MKRSMLSFVMATPEFIGIGFGRIMRGFRGALRGAASVGPQAR